MPTNVPRRSGSDGHRNSLGRALFAKLGLYQDDREHRRVLAVLTFLRGGPT
jgi:hypothetical protein